MHSVHKSSHAGQEEAAVSFPMLTESSQAEARRALDTTRYTVSARAYLLVTKNGPISLRPTVASANESADSLLHVASVCGKLLPAAELSARTCNALLKSHITTIRQFCDLELGDLKWLRNFGKKAVGEVIAYRARLGVPMKV